MSDIFSHAQPVPVPGDGTGAEMEAVEIAVVVPVPREHAFAGFTESLHLWWPFAARSFFGEDSYAGFETDVLVETAADGRTAAWGTVRSWDPGRSLSMSWYPARPASQECVLDVVFRAVGTEGTRVQVTQAGWPASSDAARQRPEDESLWNEALGRYARFMGADAEVNKG